MKKTCLSFLSLLLSLTLLTSCTGFDVNRPDEGRSTAQSTEENRGETVAAELIEVPDNLVEGKNTLSVSVSEGTPDCFAFDGNTLTFSGLKSDTLCVISGTFDGQIVIDAEDFELELELHGLTLYSGDKNPVSVLSGDKVTLTAKKGTANYIYDTRDAVASEDESAVSSAILCDCDLDIGGKGTLTVISENNNGIHTKDDLTVKNLTLTVECKDNALKGNDSVTIEGGNLTLIATAGDGIKTKNTDISAKGKQRGTVSVSGGNLTVYAACDGIDAAYNVEISGEPIIAIYTDRYSPYSEEVESGGDTDIGDVRYIRFTSNAYTYSVKYYNSDTDYVWKNATLAKTVNGGFTTYYYYAFDILQDYGKVQIFMYNGDSQGQDSAYMVKSDYMTWNTAYDTFALEQRASSLYYNWTNYSATATGMGDMGGPGGMGGGPGGMGGGPGGMQDGNTEKGDYSTKGIKADNEIHISGGTVTVKSYDDAIHTNSDTALENGETPTGNILVSGGSLTLFSKDDGIHADGNLRVTDGTIDITGSYEGLEGIIVTLDGGEIAIVSTDDGINSTATDGEGIVFNGGSVYVYAGGDGIDANSRTSYKGIVFNGGDITIISTSSGNSSIDTEQGYTYTGGSVLAVCPSNGMGSESTKCQNFSSVAVKTNLSLKASQSLIVKVGGSEVKNVTMPCGLSALVIYLGSSSASISSK